MNQINTTKIINDDEIDLFEIMQVIWTSRWKVVTAIVCSALLGIGFSVLQPDSYKASTPVYQSKSSVFSSYYLLNDTLEDYEFAPVIDSERIFQMFVAEFNDYEEVVNVLGENQFVNDALKGLDNEDKRRAVFEFAKKFALTQASKKDEQPLKLTYQWHDDTEGSQLLNDTLVLVLANVKKTIIASLEDVALYQEQKNTRELEVLRNELGYIADLQKNADKIRVQYLVEQSSIAKELGIDVDGLETKGLNKTQEGKITFNVNQDEYPLYLRGFKAIDKEISIIRSRSDVDTLLAAEGYLEISQKINRIENDSAATYLRELISLVKQDSPNDWVEYSMDVADIQSQKKPILYVAICVFLGAILGVLMVLISNTFRERNQSSTAD